MVRRGGCPPPNNNLVNQPRLPRNPRLNPYAAVCPREPDSSSSAPKRSLARSLLLCISVSLSPSCIMFPHSAADCLSLR
ncbi:hypothetical protein LZ31DRAFT_85417 [Colletotrichum somersetense]|nr:hypothetical protein LZ31DRAFT_85417 [Colletotrichum somersetense]